MKAKPNIQLGSPFYATVLFTENKPEAVITFGETKPVVCTSKLSAAVYIATYTQNLFSSLTKTQRERSDMSMFKNVSSTIEVTRNLPDYGPEDQNLQLTNHFFSIYQVQVLGSALVTIIEIFSVCIDLSVFVNTPAKKIMNKPTFNLCPDCQRHGHFLDDDGNRASHEMASREQAFKWIKEATANGYIQPKKAKELRNTIIASKKIEKKHEAFYKFLQDQLQ